ncbi:MAG: hypothetical protein K0R57_5021 [Paenibacillaceae bacterium]|jgi:hypothetical protein|nr:hypothetical protein [Paenibacillaceae bacterium]
MSDIYVDDLVIGATFWGIGYAVGSKGKTLIIEKSIRLGHEFIDCFKFGDSWDCQCQTEEGERFKEDLKTRNIISPTHRPLLQACCPMLSDAVGSNQVNLLLGTKLLSLEKTAEGYLVEAYNASGVMRICAKKVLDTVEAGGNFYRKSLNVMLNTNKRKVESIKCSEFELYEAERPDIAYLRFYVEKRDSLMTARQKTVEWLYGGPKELEGFTVISVGSVFDYEYSGIHQNSFGISGSFTNPVKAFDKGVFAGRAGESK